MNGNGYGMDEGSSWLFAVFLVVGLGLLVLLAVRSFSARSGGEVSALAPGKASGRSTARKILDDVPRRDQRGVPRAVPPRHRPAHRGWSRGRDPGLHRDRAARVTGGMRGARSSDDASARRGRRAPRGRSAPVSGSAARADPAAGLARSAPQVDSPDVTCQRHPTSALQPRTRRLATVTALSDRGARRPATRRPTAAPLQPAARRPRSVRHLAGHDDPQRPRTRPLEGLIAAAGRRATRG
jgi:hypothetical protein